MRQIESELNSELAKVEETLAVILELSVTWRSGIEHIYEAQNRAQLLKGQIESLQRKQESVQNTLTSHSPSTAGNANTTSALSTSLQGYFNAQSQALETKLQHLKDDLVIADRDHTSPAWNTSVQTEIFELISQRHRAYLEALERQIRTANSLVARFNLSDSGRWRPGPDYDAAKFEYDNIKGRIKQVSDRTSKIKHKFARSSAMRRVLLDKLISDDPPSTSTRGTATLSEFVIKNGPMFTALSLLTASTIFSSSLPSIFGVILPFFFLCISVTIWRELLVTPLPESKSKHPIWEKMNLIDNFSMAVFHFLLSAIMPLLAIYAVVKYSVVWGEFVPALALLGYTYLVVEGGKLFNRLVTKRYSFRNAIAWAEYKLKGPSGNNLVMCGRMPYTARYE